MLRLNTEEVIDNSFYGWCLFLWEVLSFTVFPHMVRGNNQFLLHFIRHYFPCIARVKLDENFTFSDCSALKENLQQGLLWIEKLKLLVEFVENQ